MVALRSASTAYLASSSSISPAEPSGAVDGDWLIAWVHGNGNVNLTDNNGSTPFVRTWQLVHSTSSATFAIFVRKRASGDPATLSFSSTGTDRIAAVVGAFQDGDSASAYDVAPSATTENENTSSSAGANDITTLSASTLHLVSVSLDSTAVGTTTPPSGYTIVGDSGLDQSMIVYYKAIPTASATGAQTYGLSRSMRWGTQSFSIKNGLVPWEQDQYRFGADDGNEASHGWIAAQNTDINQAGSTPAILRIQATTGGDQPTQQMKLQVKKTSDADSFYADVPVA